MNKAPDKEPLFEPLARKIRFNKGLKYIDKTKPISLADLGAGPKLRFYFFSKQKGIKYKKYIAIDPLIQKQSVKINKKIKLIKSPLISKIPCPKNSLDYVVSFAVLEHLDKPEHILQESVRILKPGGKAIFTTPTYMAKSILEFLSFKLNLISKREILEHKNYFNKSKLIQLLNKNFFANINHQYFELGLNNLFVITK